MKQRAYVEQIMGLPVSIHVRGPEPDSAGVRRRVELVFADLRHADAVFSPYRDDSELARWQRREPVTDPGFPVVLALCDEARARTEGWFDPRELPDPRTGAPRFDPSGLVKGWAVQEASQHLKALRLYSWCLNAGGDVLVHTAGNHPAWRIGIEHPDHPGHLLHVLERRTGAVATSGPARRGGHIIDPTSGRPATAVRSVTVTGPDLLWSDVYATAAAARGPRSLSWLDTLDGHAALLLSTSGLTRVTANWPLPG